MGKGEIARHEQFLLFQQCFQKACFPGASKDVIVWEWVNASAYIFNIDQRVHKIYEKQKTFDQNHPEWTARMGESSPKG